VQVVLGHRRGFQRDVHDLVAGGHAQVSRCGQVRAARARPDREVRHRVIGAPGPGKIRPRSPWLLAWPAPPPALAALRLHRRRRAARQVISRRRHRGVAAVTAQPMPQLGDLLRQRSHIGPQLIDRRSLLRDHPVPGRARRATRRSRRQTGHNRPSSPPTPCNQADTLSRTRKHQRSQPGRPPHRTAAKRPVRT
jgi:hypothetical protein